MHKCPDVKATDEASARQQSLNWLVCASAAAGKDLSPIFVDRWRMPLGPEQRELLENTSFDDDNFDPAPVIDRLTRLRKGKE